MTRLVGRRLLEIALCGSLLSVAWAQQPAAGPETPETPREVPAAAAAPKSVAEPETPRAMRRRHAVPAEMAPPSSRGPGGGMGGFGGGPFGRSFAGPRGFRHVSPEEDAELEALSQAIHKFKSAKSDADKTTAKNEISKALEKVFKRDMERREKQIADVEARVKKLREQLENRTKAKDEILSLHLKTIVNEAEGLGFPGHFDQDSEVFAQPEVLRWRTPTPPVRLGFSPEAEDFAPPAPPAADR